MTARTLQAVLRTLSAAPAETDADLLRRHLAGEAEAFAELVRRHGRLVWSVCRHLTRSDAEADDAFQATFLVLVKNAGKIRDAARLSAWLHGVAYRVSSKARLAANRRATRERAAAVSERNGHAVADSAWDRTLAVVHEEVGKLPEALRVAFVLCCLEGKGVTEAAEQLGWKLGTLSGRLTRAKDALLARLEARGLTLGAIAALGLAAPPAAVLAKAAALAKVGLVIPVSILQLSQGVIGMSTFSFKMLAASILVACGLGLGVGSGWVSTAEAQTPQKVPPSKSDPDAEVKRLQSQLQEAVRAAEAARAGSQLNSDLARQVLEDAQERLAAQSQKEYSALIAQLLAQSRDPKETYTAKTPKWEYDFVEVSDLNQTRFLMLLQDRENRGWDYNGMTTLKDGARKQDIWVFRRPAKGAVADSLLLEQYYKQAADTQKTSPNANQSPLALDAYRRAVSGATADRAKPADAKAIEAEIARLHDQLAKLNAKSTKPRLVIEKKDLPLPPAQMADVLAKLAANKFKNADVRITHSESGITVEGEKQVLDWVAEMVKALGKQ